MSTLKVNKIEATGTTDGGIEIDSDGHVQMDGMQLPTTGALSNRNLFINGACLINQREANQEWTESDAKFGPTDHFETRVVGDEWQGETSHETVNVNNEFVRCHRVKTTTPETTVDGTNQIVVESHIEGQSLQHLGWNTSAAKSLTLSFWVRSSQTGTYVVKLYRVGDAGRQLNKTYTIGSADTWQQVTLTWDGDTTGGAFPNDSTQGIRVAWQLAAGGDFTSGTQPTTWTDYTNPIWASGHTENSFMTTDDATWDVTGVQLEVGDMATPFEHRSYSDYLIQCQRYFLKIAGDANNYMAQTTNGYTRVTLLFPVTMRAAASCSSSGWSLWGTAGAVSGYYNTQGNATLPTIQCSAEL